MKHKIVTLIFLSVFLIKPTASNAQSQVLVPVAAWLAYKALNINNPILVKLPDVRQDNMVDISSYRSDKQMAFNFCMEKLRSEILRLKPNSSTNYIHGFKNDIFFAQIMKKNQKPKKEDFLVIFSSPDEQTRTYNIVEKINTPRYGYKTFFYVGSRMSNAKFTMQQDLAANEWGIDLVPNTYSLDFVLENATRDTVLELDPYFDGVLEDLTIKGN